METLYATDLTVGHTISQPELSTFDETQTVEEKLLRLQIQMNNLTRHVDERIDELTRRIDVESNRSIGKLREVSNDISSVSTKIEGVFIGNIGFQLLGVLWMIIGAVLGHLG